MAVRNLPIKGGQGRSAPDVCGYVLSIGWVVALAVLGLVVVGVWI